ncbi:uncharacterized protein LOC107617612 [Arachis ipaensis]|uniref:Uncharacterized protein n=1 Tax=Arachis hypogaea TaxID=3818 RepID=A0A444XTH0_ARAHY|nr:uncharacterized protein LOC107617612 [Arachis ipaensis]QHN79105.1 uncharacterized protein DS421_19g667230 [Arachis hypogaea]RYQ93012.1 hypothetical protein Ahy_B09g099268 [Arachis hypogaea]
MGRLVSRSTSCRKGKKNSDQSVTTETYINSMEEEKAPLIGEIEEVDATATAPTTTTDEVSPKKQVRTKVPEVEIHLYRQGKGPIAVFKSNLGGWEQDQLEVREILEKYGLKSIFVFNPQSGRGVPIRFHRNGRSILTYHDGATVYVDGEPKDSVLKPVTRILIGVLVITFMIALVSRDTPEWIKKYNILGTNSSPWVLACIVIVFTRMRKRTKDFLKKYGW